MMLNLAWARIVGAAAVLIAVSLMPSAAWAHGSHAQHGAQSASASEKNGSVEAARAGRGAAASKRETRAAVSALASGPKPAGDATCLGSCCGTGSGCCPGVMAITVDFPWVAPTAGRLPPFRGGLLGPGADLEALPKPPKVLV